MPQILYPFWRYFGGKWRAARLYPKPRYETIVEPFAGAAGYSLRYHWRKVILIERYAVLAEMWRYLIDVSATEVRSIPIVDHVDDLPASIPPPARSLVGFHMNAGTTSPRMVLSAGLAKHRALGRTFSGWTEATRYRVASQLEYIRHWQVIEGDALIVAPDIRATWFIDPPYEVAGRHYVHGSSAIDYARLAAWCLSRVGQTIVCEAEGASWLPFRRFGDIRASAMSGKRGTSSEVIWTSGDTQLEM